jgi:lipopolysaccharide transport system ATP-binding protein
VKADPNASVEALRGISFDVDRGEAFGVIGRNGSGKSTLLKIISGILKPTGGSVFVDGRVSALIELGAGFHPEISGRENVFINGIMLGLTRREIEKRFDQIVEFAAIGEYLDQPVKTYSSGMYVRLGFAVAVNVEPDILLIDEVLAVGDEEFSQRCLAKIQEMKYRGVTMLFVTHQLDLVRNLCDRALWLDHGTIAGMGDPVRTVDAYLQNVSGLEAPQEADPEEDVAEDASDELVEEERWGSGEVLLTRVALTDGRGGDLVAVGTGSRAAVEIDVRVREPQTDFVFGIGIYHADGTCVYGTNTELEGLIPQRLEGEGKVRFDISSLDLVAGSYRIDTAVHSRNGRAFDYRRGAVRFAVGSRIHDVGVYRPKHEWKFDGGIEFRSVDVLEKNVPAPMAEYLKEEEASQPKYRKRRRRKKDPEPPEQ